MLTYTKNVPTEPGYYFLRHPHDANNTRRRPVVRYFTPQDGKLLDTSSSLDADWYAANGFEFAGPIPLPAEAEKLPHPSTPMPKQTAVRALRLAFEMQRKYADRYRAEMEAEFEAALEESE